MAVVKYLTLGFNYSKWLLYKLSSPVKNFIDFSELGHESLKFRTSKRSSDFYDYIYIYIHTMLLILTSQTTKELLNGLV